MSLDEIQTLFKYQPSKISGTKKEPHDREGFIRTLKDGRKIKVKKTQVNGGKETSRFYYVK